MRKNEDIRNLISFSIMDNYVKSGEHKIYFYRFYPPNISILTEREIEQEIQSLANFLESANMPIQVFAMDKVENLSRNKEFFENMDEKFKKYTSQIVEQISSHDTDESKTNSVQRAYYFVIKIKTDSERSSFEDALRGQHLKYSLVKKGEIATVFRNYFLREFSEFDILYFNKEMRAKYDGYTGK